MRTRSLHLELMTDDVESDQLLDRSETNRKNYSRGRSARTPKRRSTRTTGNQVPLGMAARRNRRWAW